jgi:hypothetical protein
MSVLCLSQEKISIITLCRLNCVVFVTESGCLLCGTDWVFKFWLGRFPSLAHVRFVVDKVVRRLFSCYFGFSLSISFHQCAVVTFIYTLLLPEAEPSKKMLFRYRGSLDKIELPVFCP